MDFSEPLPENMLLLFKSLDSRMAAHSGKGKVFFHTLCTGQYASYDAAAINGILTSEENTEFLWHRMVELMDYLQKGYHQDSYSGVPARYSRAQVEYREHYVALVAGLSEEALEIIRTLDMSEYTLELPENSGRCFYDQLMKDRQELLSHKAAMRTESFLTPNA